MQSLNAISIFLYLVRAICYLLKLLLSGLSILTQICRRFPTCSIFTSFLVRSVPSMMLCIPITVSPLHFFFNECHHRDLLHNPGVWVSLVGKFLYPLHHFSIGDPDRPSHFKRSAIARHLVCNYLAEGLSYVAVEPLHSDL